MVKHRGMEFDEEVKHVAMKHVRLSEENAWPVAHEQPEERLREPRVYRHMGSYPDDAGG